MHEYLKSSYFFNFDHHIVQGFGEKHSPQSLKMTPTERACSLYLAVRDQVRYNPYLFSFDSSQMRASEALKTGESYCTPKAIALGALCRMYGIPAGVGFADVRNHLATKKFLEYLGTDVFAMHGYIEIYLEGRWVIATPAFNKSLCEKMGVSPLEFDGLHDSVFQAFTPDGKQSMEYIVKHGVFAEPPVDLIFNHLRQTYPKLSQQIDSHNFGTGSSFENDLKE